MSDSKSQPAAKSPAPKKEAAPFAAGDKVMVAGREAEVIEVGKFGPGPHQGEAAHRVARREEGALVGIPGRYRAQALRRLTSSAS